MTNRHQDERRLRVDFIARAAAALTLLIVPAYHLIDVIAGQAPAELLRQQALWRIPALLVAVGLLAQVSLRPKAEGTVWLLRLLTLAIMAMMFGMFAFNAQHPEGDPERMARGLILVTFAVSLLSIGGAREVLAIFTVPFVACLAWLWRTQADLHELTLLLVDPLMMLAVALITAELFYRLRERSVRLETELERLAATDALTGLANRRDFEDRLQDEMARSKRHGEPLSVVLGDLDHFKRVNDTYGHGTGDQLLRQIGHILQKDLREEDLAVRWGGEEFLLMLPATDLEHAVETAERIRSTIAARPIRCDTADISITISFGAAQYAAGELITQLIRRADEAMYRAKSEGRNRVCC